MQEGAAAEAAARAVWHEKMLAKFRAFIPASKSKGELSAEDVLARTEPYIQFHETATGDKVLTTKNKGWGFYDCVL